MKQDRPSALINQLKRLIKSNFVAKNAENLLTSLLAGVKVGRVHLCRVAGNTVSWESH